MLLYSCDVVILPYKLTSSLGVLIDALAHGVPFIASDLAFFREFAQKGLGFIFKKREDIPKLLSKITEKSDELKPRIMEFAKKLSWKNVALSHINI